MKALFCTTASIGEGTGGGVVSLHEVRALHKYAGNVVVYTPESFDKLLNPTWGLDIAVAQHVDDCFDVAWFNGNPWIETVKTLKHLNPDVKIVSSVPAHNLQRSIMEHKRLGIPHEKLYPHLHKPELWRKYIAHINQSNLVFTPSRLSEKWLRELPYIDEGLRVETVPHGVNPPSNPPPPPETWRPVYYGANGPDKGVHLLPPTVEKRGRAFGRDFASLGELMAELSIGVFPSVTEAFNICALECVAYGRPVLLSEYAGAYEWLEPVAIRIEDLSPEGITRQLEYLEKHQEELPSREKLLSHATRFTWSRVEEEYVEHLSTL